jgi:hypothetical protein
LKKGAKIKAVATVDGERLESQDAVIVESGLRIILVATDPSWRSAKKKIGGSPQAGRERHRGLGPESRVIAEMQSDRLNIYYMIQIVNSARTPIDIGGR